MHPVLQIFWKKHRHRVGLGYFISGFLAGCIVSSCLILRPRLSTLSTLSSTIALPSSILQPSTQQCQPLCFQDNGWNPIHVFYGDTNHIQYYSAITNSYLEQVSWYSQARQDEVVAALLRNKRGGYFVDLAANDAIKISNTFALERNFDWTGLCLEPNPTYWAGLAYRHHCHIVGAVVGSHRMDQIQFRFPNKKAPKGGIVGKDMDNTGNAEEGGTQSVGSLSQKYGEEQKPKYTVTLAEILERFHAPANIDYLSLDVEGAEGLVLEKFPFDKYQFTIITLERPTDSLKELLSRNGYHFLRTLKLNSGETLWVHKSKLDQLDIKASCKIDTMRKYRERPTAKEMVDVVKDDYCATKE